LRFTQEEKDRRRAENDYKVNLKTEIMIEDIFDKVTAILKNNRKWKSNSAIYRGKTIPNSQKSRYCIILQI